MIWATHNRNFKTAHFFDLFVRNSFLYGTSNILPRFCIRFLSYDRLGCRLLQNCSCSFGWKPYWMGSHHQNLRKWTYPFYWSYSMYYSWKCAAHKLNSCRSLLFVVLFIYLFLHFLQRSCDSLQFAVFLRNALIVFALFL